MIDLFDFNCHFHLLVLFILISLFFILIFFLQLSENTISYVFYFFFCVLKFSQWLLIILPHKKKIVKLPVLLKKIIQHLQM